MTLVYLYYGEEMMVDLWQQAGQQRRGTNHDPDEGSGSGGGGGSSRV